MAQQARLTIWVTKSASDSTVRYSTTGTYAGTSMNTVSNLLRSQPLFTTSSAAAFWDAVLAVVSADIARG